MGGIEARGAARWPARTRPPRSRAPEVVVGVLAAAAIGVAACHRVFTCEDASSCSLDGVAGACEPSGYCSFPDDACDSGRRFGAHAELGLAGECVPGGDDPPGGSTTEDGAGDDGSSGSGGAGPTTSTDGSSSGVAGEDTSHDPCDGLEVSGPVSASADGEVIAGLRIDVDRGPAIEVDGLSGVTIRDCEIHHRGGSGISFRAAPDLRIENVIVVHDGAPEAGPHSSGDQANIEGRDSTGVVIDGVRLSRGSSGLVLESTPGALLSGVEVHDVRGPGAGACVRLFDSDEAILEDFSCENPLDTGRPGDLIAVEASSNVTVRRGLLDGNNAEFGYGVHMTHVSGQSAGGLVEDVDAIRMTNGAFSCFEVGSDITFRRTRARENICEILSVPIEDCDNPGPNGGCIPGSDGISWGASFQTENIVIEDSVYFELCHAPLWPEEAFTIAEGDLVEADFQLREPIRLTMCWEDA